jgi:hypothetical protein
MFPQSILRHPTGGGAIKYWIFTSKYDGNAIDQSDAHYLSEYVESSQTTFFVPSKEGKYYRAQFKELDYEVIYEFTVRAVYEDNILGDAKTVTLTRPITAPAEPTFYSKNFSFGTFTMTWTIGDDGGSPITSTKVSVDGGEFIVLDGARTYYSFDTNSAAHDVTVILVNAIGESEPVTFR